MQKAFFVYNVYFYNSANENEHYGTFKTRKDAEALIAKVQAEHGTECFADADFSIEVSYVK
jgi:hypothetical protein